MKAEPMMPWRSRVVWLAGPLVAALSFLLSQCPGYAAETAPLQAGFAHTDITPDLAPGAKPVWLAGYGQGRRATGIHDKLYCRCVVLEHQGKKIALAAVDLVGLQYPAVQRIREQLPNFHYVLVSSTHNHEGPDVIGIWGPHPLATGVNEAYIDLVVERVVAAVRQAAERLAPVEAAFGTHADELLVRDSRLPRALDGVLRAVRLNSVPAGQPAGLLVQFSCHPESLGRDNPLVTCDFPYATVAALEKRYGCPVVYFSGAVGGLMGNPPEWPDGEKTVREGTFEFAEVYGKAVAASLAKAIDGAEPVALTPFAVAARPIAVPLENKLYVAARGLGVLSRAGRVWKGEAETLGEPDDGKNPQVPSAVETEVAYLALGQVHVAAIPGEIYPELVYGTFQDPADAAADFPAAPLEPTVEKTMRSPKWLLVGLANDEIGYIIPKRQWDTRPPFAYGRKESQYGEVNSCGSEIAPLIMQALVRRAREAVPEAAK